MMLASRQTKSRCRIGMQILKYSVSRHIYRPTNLYLVKFDLMFRFFSNQSKFALSLTICVVLISIIRKPSLSLGIFLADLNRF